MGNGARAGGSSVVQFRAGSIQDTNAVLALLDPNVV
jgi:GNAT superfamily N-acetyltransferase